MAKSVSKKNVPTAKKSPYLTKRALERAVSKGTRRTSSDAIRQRGHVVTAKDGWLVKVNRDGTEERISKLPATKTNGRIVLD